MAQISRVPRTYKLLIGGAFARSESGRTYAVTHPQMGEVNVPLGSRKDLRDAVRAARTSWPVWSGKTAYNRGQILYRMAEVVDSRRNEFAELLGSGPAATREVTAAVDTLVWYAGICDKTTQLAGTINPVAGPFLCVSVPEATGVVAVVAPATSGLKAWVAGIAPALAGGNSVVAIARESDPLAALTFGEVAATSDVPSGVLNIISGRHKELLSWLGAHKDVNAIDVTGCSDAERKEVARAAADSVTRVVRFASDTPTPQRVTAMMEVKTTWHPVGV